MSRFALLRHRLPVAGGGSAPIINAVTASGVIKRQGMAVGIYIEDDGTATSFRYDVQANGSHLTGVSIRDGSSTITHDFPYTTTSNYIQFDAPGALALQPYTITGDASGDAWAHATGPTTALENFSHQSDLFTPNTRAAPTVTRQTPSGTTAIQVLIGSPAYEGDNLRIKKLNLDGSVAVSSVVAIMDPALTGGFTLAVDGSFDPQPVPAIGSITVDNSFEFSWETADFAISGGAVASGLASAPAAVSVTDPAGFRYAKIKTGDTAILRSIELATSVGGSDVASGKSYSGSGWSITGGPNETSYCFDGDPNTKGAIYSGSANPEVIIDLGIARDIHQLRMQCHGDFLSQAPATIELRLSNSLADWSAAAVVNVSGVTWTGDGTAANDQTHTWSF